MTDVTGDDKIRPNFPHHRPTITARRNRGHPKAGMIRPLRRAAPRRATVTLSRVIHRRYPRAVISVRPPQEMTHDQDRPGCRERAARIIAPATRATIRRSEAGRGRPPPNRRRFGQPRPRVPTIPSGRPTNPAHPPGPRHRAPTKPLLRHRPPRLQGSEWKPFWAWSGCSSSSYKA